MTTSSYMPDVVVEVAFGSGFSTAAASRVWTDVSAYVELDRTIGITYGRGDEFSEVEPSQVTLTLNNRDGRFTAGLASSPYYPNVKLMTPIRVKATPVGGAEVVRFVGYVTKWPVEWNGTDADAWATVTATSRSARLGRTNPLSNVIYEEFRRDNPVAHYMLGEPEGSTTAVDATGNDAPSLVVRGTGAAVTFGTATGPGTDDLTAVSFAGGKYLETDSALVSGVVGLDLFVLRSGTPASNRIIAAASDGTNWVALIIDNGGGVSLAGNGLQSTTSTATITDGNYHHLYWDIANADIWIDGVADGGGTGSLAVTNPTTVTIGGWRGNEDHGTTEPHMDGTNGVAHVALYTAAPSGARKLEHYTAGHDGFAGETSADRIERYAAYAGVPTAEVSIDAAAVTPIAHIDTTGKSPVELLKLVSDTEGGQVFDARDGTLTYVSRNARYNAATGLTLNIATGMVEADVAPVYDDQALVNDSTATIPSGEETTTVGRVVDQDSVDAYGPYRQDLELHTTDAIDAAAAAGWLVNTHSEPATRISSLSTDVVQLDSATQADALEADIATRVLVTNWPSQVGSTYANGFFVEGYTETISPESWVITFNVSPADHYDVFTLDHADRGDLDSIYPLAW